MSKRVLFPFFLLLAVVAGYSAGPQWWSERGVVNTNAVVTNDYSVVNLGQLKNISKHAYDECIARGLPRNTKHDALEAALYSWFNEEVPVHYNPANVGQVKNIGSLFHDWLDTAGYKSAMSFQHSGNDYAVANVGQVKNVFSFDPSETDYNDNGFIGALLSDTERIRVDGDYETDIAYWYIFGAIPEQEYFGDPGDVILEFELPPWVNDIVVHPEKTWWRKERNARSPMEYYYLSSAPDKAAGWSSAGLRFDMYVYQYSKPSYSVPEDESIRLSSLPYQSPTEQTVIRVVYTGGGKIKLDSGVYLLQWAPRIVFKETSPK